MNTSCLLKGAKNTFKLPEDVLREMGLTYFSYGLLSQGEAS